MNDILKTKRLRVNLTQVEVAKRAKITPRTYQYYEAGARIPAANIAVDIANAVESSVEEIFGQKYSNTNVRACQTLPHTDETQT